MRFTSSLAAVAGLASFASLAFAQTVNQPPTISGTPPSVVKVNTSYNFQPTARDPEGRPLKFSLVNKPGWMVLAPNSGQLMGYPKSPGTYNNIILRVTDGVNTVSLPPFSVTVNATGTLANRAPTISGTPATTATVGTAYSFQPSAADPDGNTLGFSITNRPSWAAFSTSTGRLSGTPTASQVGTYSNITVSVSDGRATTSLPAFAISVVDISNGGATLSWLPPTANTDGSSLTNLAGYRISYGTNASAMTQTIQVSNPGVTTYTLGNLSPGTYYFSVRAYTSNGTESAGSNISSKLVQ
jgi:hypothetical protein